MYRPAGITYSDRYLDRDERYELARLKDAGHSLREIGRRMGRNASTISRELGRNRDPRTGEYQPERAHALSWQRQRRPKPSKLSGNTVLRAEVQRLLTKRYSPDQIAGRLRLLHPDNEAMQISHESIYQSLYVYPRGELRRELKACLRSGRTVRRRRGSQSETRGKIPGAVSIHDRPEDVETRLVPGHHEGDLIMGSTASNSAVGTIVERTTGYLTLLHLPHGHTADRVADAVVEQMTALPDWFTKTLTWDRGSEMARHARITEQTGIAVYFADPYHPWQRGSNENTNGLVREYLPKGTDLSVHTATHLAAIADELNDRPRKRLGYHTPREMFASLLIQDLDRVATTP
ncbi:IS30 family transposase [Kribbella sindirgiensis]|uniref:IS30 family transposase n=1 Tax=Kribbella sindirgiensis TaxID=1124744 RepID=A0A4V6N3R8_9ACTN|nr:IS30 family transposase [Kribbella sindirgiensis]